MVSTGRPHAVAGMRASTSPMDASSLKAGITTATCGMRRQDNGGVRTLITGGCGFVGANLVPMLLGRGDEVRVLDDFSAGGRDRLQGAGAEVVEGDVRDAGAMARAVAGMDAVIHLAASGN